VKNNKAYVLDKLQLDAAAVHSLIYRGWQSFAGAITLVFVIRLLSPGEQGLYFTFASLIAFQAVVELGMSYVSTQFAGHEMTELAWSPDNILVGSDAAKSRIRDLFHISSLWSIISGLVLISVLLPAGLWLLRSRQEVAEILNWQPAWVWLVIATGAFVASTPGLAILEGCGRVAEVARFRTINDVIAYLGFWLCLGLGYGLLAFPVLVTIRVLLSVAWLVRVAYAPWRDLKNRKAARIDWRQEVWPMQWRIAVSWSSGFAMFQLANPIAYQSLGPTAAGKIGITLAATSAITSLAVATVTARIPLLTRLIAQRRYTELDTHFRRIAAMATTIALLAAAAFILALVIASEARFEWTSRIAPIFDSAVLAAVAVSNVVISSLAVYLRAHKREPLMLYSVSSAAVIPGALWIGAAKAGITGLVLAYALTSAVFGTLWVASVFASKRREWHTSPAE
jgi:O-antigen/teichoic acid export membrane protein